MSEYEGITLGVIFGAALIILVGALLINYMYAREKNEEWGDDTLFSLKGEFNQVSTYGLCTYDIIGVLLIIVLFSANFATPQGAKDHLPLAINVIVGGLIMAVPAFFVFLRLFVFRRRDVLQSKDSINWVRIGYSIIVTLVIIWCFNISYESSGLSKWIQELMGSNKNQDVVDYLLKGSIKLKIAIGFTAVIIAPITEELYFRGYIYQVFKRYAGLVPSLVFSSLFFGLVHGNIVAFPMLALFGALLALLYEYTKSLWAPILAHFIFNATTVVAICFFDINP